MFNIDFSIDHDRLTAQPDIPGVSAWMRLAHQLFLSRVVLANEKHEIVWGQVPLFAVMEVLHDAQFLETDDRAEYVLPSHEDQLTVSVTGQNVELNSQVCSQTIVVGLEEFRAAIQIFIRDADSQIGARIKRPTDRQLLTELDQFRT